MSRLPTNGVGTKAQRSTGPTMAYATDESLYKRAGWLLFAGIMFVVSGSLTIIWGIAAVSSSHFFVANATYILSDLNTWGWIVTCFGVVEFIAAASIWRGGEFGRWFGIVVGGLAAIVAMLTIPAYPFWSLTLFALYVLVVYGLAAYGGKPYLTK